MEPVICPFCSSEHVSKHDVRERSVWDINGETVKKIRLKTSRYNCVDCGKRFSVAPEGIMPSAAATVRLADEIALRAMDSTFSMIEHDLIPLSKSEIIRIYLAWVRQETERRYARAIRHEVFFLHAYEIRDSKFLFLFDAEAHEPIDCVPYSVDAAVECLQRIRSAFFYFDTDDNDLIAAIKERVSNAQHITTDTQFIARTKGLLWQAGYNIIPRRMKTEDRDTLLSVALTNREELTEEQAALLDPWLEKHTGISKLYHAYQRLRQVLNDHIPDDGDTVSYCIEHELESLRTVPEAEAFVVYVETVKGSLSEFQLMEEQFDIHWGDRGVSWREYMPADYMDSMHAFLDGYVRTYGSSSELFYGRVLFNLYKGKEYFEPEYTILGKNGL